MVKLKYELPDSNNFLRALVALLKQQGHHALASLITGAKLSISLEDIPQKPDTLEDLKNITHELPQEIKDVILPEDIISKAKEMSQVYLYTYCAENSLRAFIVKVSAKELGADYLSKLNLSRDMKNKI